MLNLNGKIFSESPAGLDLFSRGFFYADGLFETLRVFNGRLPFLSAHLRRLFSGMDALRFVRPEVWTTDFFQTEILKIAPPNARVRLTIWRETGGWFLPENGGSNFLIQAESLTVPKFSFQEQELKMGISQRVVLPCDAFSNFKTLNSARYVAAAIEAKELGCDDVFIRNQHGRVCETTIANVFIFCGNKLITPALSEGCVAGTMRETVLALAENCGIASEERPVDFSDLSLADEIYLTNAIKGIVPVSAFEGRGLPNERAKKLMLCLNELVEN